MWLKRLGKEVEFLWEGKQLEFSYDAVSSPFSTQALIIYPHDLRHLFFKLHDFISCFNIVKTSRPTFCENKAASWRRNRQENCREVLQSLC